MYCWINHLGKAVAHPDSRGREALSTDQLCVSLKGPQTEAQLRNLYSRAAVYAATARYEPFGMEPLEAALSRCAIIANDIPSYREIWGDDAIYFRTNDATSLAARSANLAKTAKSAELTRIAPTSAPAIAITTSA